MEDGKHLMAGLVSGFSQAISGHPFDTLKTNKQIGIKTSGLYRGIVYPFFTIGIQNSLNFGVYQFTKKYTENNFISGALSGLIVSPFTSSIELLKIRKQNKVMIDFNIFKGMKITALRESIGVGLYFGMYEYLKNYLIQKEYSENFSILLSGGIAGANSWLWTYPIDNIKTKIQSNIKFNLINEIKHPKMLYRGLSFCLARGFICNMAGFYAYEHTLKYLV